jgi:hypothetical protein
MARVLVHVSDERRVVVDPETISHVQLHGELSRVHRPGAEPLDDVRKLGALAVHWKTHGFVRVSEACLLNPSWVRELRRGPAPDRRWALVLADAEGTALELEREQLQGLWAAYGER